MSNSEKSYAGPMLITGLVTGGLIASAIGLFPLVGPGRAAQIALHSRFAFKPNRMSMRTSEIKMLRNAIAKKDFGQNYLVLMGVRGIGKTCLLQSATYKMPGVVNVVALPEDSAEAIINNTL